MAFGKAFMSRASILLLALTLLCGPAPRAEAGARRVVPGGRSLLPSLLTRGAPQQGARDSIIVFESGGEIYLVYPDGSGLTQLTDTMPSVYNYQPALSPDGTRVAFGSSGDHKSEIKVMNVDGSGLRSLTGNTSNYDGEPTWSPDGTRIAFVRGFDLTRDGIANLSSCPSEIYAINADGTGGLVNLTQGGGGTDPSWSPDGRRIAFASQREGSYDIYTMTTDGGEVKQLTTAATQESEPAWSPDGASIAYVSGLVTAHLDCGFAHTGTSNIPYANGPDIYLMAEDGTGQRRVTYTANNSEPTWSPDGASLAFVSWRNAQTQLYTRNLFVRIETQITSGADYKSSPSWSRAGRPTSGGDR